MNDFFELIRGEENNLLPGKMFDVFKGYINDDNFNLVSNKNEIFKLKFSSIKHAKFSKAEYKKNLWLTLLYDDNKIFTFCATPKSWKKKNGKLLIKKINEVTPIENINALNIYMSSFVDFWACLFKSFLEKL